jgi:hypothetical protein
MEFQLDLQGAGTSRKASYEALAYQIYVALNLRDAIEIVQARDGCKSHVGDPATSPRKD